MTVNERMESERIATMYYSDDNGEDHEIWLLSTFDNGYHYWAWNPLTQRFITVFIPWGTNLPQGDEYETLAQRLDELDTQVAESLPDATCPLLWRLLVGVVCNVLLFYTIHVDSTMSTCSHEGYTP